MIGGIGFIWIADLIQSALHAIAAPIENWCKRRELRFLCYSDVARKLGALLEAQRSVQCGYLCSKAQDRLTRSLTDNEKVITGQNRDMSLLKKEGNAFIRIQDEARWTVYEVLFEPEKGPGAVGHAVKFIDKMIMQKDICKSMVAKYGTLEVRKHIEGLKEDKTRTGGGATFVAPEAK